MQRAETQSGEQLSESLEDYLEAIFHIESEKQAVRAKDIADRLSVKGASVTGALHQLASRKLVNYVPYDLITLTSEGKTMAAEVVRRHEALTEFFRDVLGADPLDAEEGACRSEHALSPEIISRLAAFVEFLKSSSGEGGRGLIQEFKRVYQSGKSGD